MKYKVYDFSNLALYVHDLLYVPLGYFYAIMSNAILHTIMFFTTRATNG